MEEIEVSKGTEETSATEPQNENPQAESSSAADQNEQFVPDDELLERGVRAGMKLSDVQALSSKEMAERIIGAMESRSANPVKGNAVKNGETDGDAIPAISFEGFSEDDGYDPKLVAAMSSLKATVEAQNKVIAKLLAGQSPKSKPAVAEVRRNLTLARPGGETGKRRDTPASTEAAVLSELRQKFKLN